jgi:hypothetical protein
MNKAISRKQPLATLKTNAYHNNQRGEVCFCPYNNKLRCPIKRGHCPLQDSLFTRDLEFFLFTGRAPRSADWNPSKRRHFGTDLDFSHFLKALKAMCFGDDPIFEYAEFQKTGRIAMTKSKCLTWRMARAKWKRLLKERE